MPPTEMSQSLALIAIMMPFILIKTKSMLRHVEPSALRRQLTILV
jgi:ABC-type phosphate transport system permease subunit